MHVQTQCAWKSHAAGLFDSLHLEQCKVQGRLGSRTGSGAEAVHAGCAENEHCTDLEKLVIHCKHFPGLLASEDSLEQATAELDRTYEQVGVFCHSARPLL